LVARCCRPKSPGRDQPRHCLAHEVRMSERNQRTEAHLEPHDDQPPNDARANDSPTHLFVTHPHKMASVQSVQCFGKKKTATAVAHCKQGKGLIKVNGQPLSLVEPQVLRFKVYEPVLLLGLDKFGTCV
jgi:hypothetical protein